MTQFWLKKSTFSQLLLDFFPLLNSFLNIFSIDYNLLKTKKIRPQLNPLSFTFVSFLSFIQNSRFILEGKEKIRIPYFPRGPSEHSESHVQFMIRWGFLECQGYGCLAFTACQSQFGAEKRGNYNKTETLRNEFHPYCFWFKCPGVWLGQ